MRHRFTTLIQRQKCRANNWSILQKVLGPLYLGLPGNINLTINFIKISHQGNALSPSMFELSYPFKKEGLYLVPKVLVYCHYDAFIASILCTTKMGFQFWEHIEVRWSHIRRISGMRKNFKSTFSQSSHCNLWRMGRGIVLQEQNTVVNPCLLLGSSS